MQNGDLSNRVSPRLLLVFEGALGYLHDEKNWRKHSGKGKWEKAMDCWTLNELMVRRIMWLFHKKDINLEVVTFLGDSFADELATLLDTEGIPVSAVWSTSETRLARSISYMPDLAFVYDPEPTRWLTYGSKGRFLSDVNQLGMEWTSVL